MKPGGVATRPRHAVDKSGADRIGNEDEDDRHAAGRLQQRSHACGAACEDDVGCERDQFRSVLAGGRSVPGSPSVVDAQVSADGPAQRLEPLQECCDARLSFRILCGEGVEHADAPHPFALLRPRRERPRCSAAEERDEGATFHRCNHSITSSASASSVGGNSMPNTLAVLRLMKSTKWVGCNTGKSLGFSPLRIRPT